MLIPDKYTDLNYSLINVSAIIIEYLMKEEFIEYNVLLNILQKRIGVRVVEVYNYALSFLYLIDKIEYLKEIDALRLKNENF